MKPGEHGLEWVCIDFDGTLAANLWPDEAIGEPIHRNVVKLREAHRAGWKIRIFTARPRTDQDHIAIWLRANNIPYQAIRCGKPAAAIYVDDRAVHESEASWLP